MNIPDRVTLSCIGYYVKVVEGMVLFSSEPSIAGCYTRISFQRVDQCWYVSLIDSGNKVMVSHVEQAYAMVKEWFGDNFKGKNGENNP